MQIQDGMGTGKKAHVDNNNRLEVKSFSESIQHTMSHVDEQAYQAIGISNLRNGVTPVLHLTNNSTNRDVVVTHIRHQVLDNSGGTAFPNSSNYLRIALGRIYDSGGVEVMPTNINTNSGNNADVTIFNGNATLSGTATVIDRWYTKAAGDMYEFNKEGSLIIGIGDTLELSYVGDQTAGVVYSRLSFLMKRLVE